MITTWIINTLFGGSAVTYFYLLLAINSVFTAIIVYKPSRVRKVISDYMDKIDIFDKDRIFYIFKVVIVMNILGMVSMLYVHGWSSDVPLMVEGGLLALVIIQTVYLFEILKSLKEEKC